MKPLNQIVDKAWHDYRTLLQLDVPFEEEVERDKLAGRIDHTALKADVQQNQIEQLCAEARAHRFASVCVNPVWVSLCNELLKGSGIPVCTVVGFPLGASTTPVKAEETRQAVSDGATEIDMVINIGFLKDNKLNLVYEDIQTVVEAAHPAHVKVIIEACLLTEKEKVTACVLSKQAGAHFVKTSTGMSIGGATVEDVKLMRQIVGKEMGIKAAGGIRDYETAAAMVAAGATRLGASAGLKIIGAE